MNIFQLQIHQEPSVAKESEAQTSSYDEEQLINKLVQEKLNLLEA